MVWKFEPPCTSWIDGQTYIFIVIVTSYRPVWTLVEKNIYLLRLKIKNTENYRLVNIVHGLRTRVVIIINQEILLSASSQTWIFVRTEKIVWTSSTWFAITTNTEPSRLFPVELWVVWKIKKVKKVKKVKKIIFWDSKNRGGKSLLKLGLGQFGIIRIYLANRIFPLRQTCHAIPKMCIEIHWNIRDGCIFIFSIGQYNICPINLFL